MVNQKIAVFIICFCVLVHFAVVVCVVAVAWRPRQMPQTLWHDDGNLSASFERLHTHADRMSIAFVYCTRPTIISSEHLMNRCSSRPQVSGGETSRAALICQVHTGGWSSGQRESAEREEERGPHSGQIECRHPHRHTNGI